MINDREELMDVWKNILKDPPKNVIISDLESLIDLAGFALDVRDVIREKTFYKILYDQEDIPVDIAKVLEEEFMDHLLKIDKKEDEDHE